MSGDELFIFVISAVLGIVLWLRWYALVGSHAPLAAGSDVRVPLLIAPPVCLIGLVVLLKVYAAHDVRDSFIYMLMYSVMGVAWIGLWRTLSPLLGIGLRDDALQRGNPAAADALAGLLVGLTLCFVGANFGDGPGWWVVVFCAALSSGSLLGLWWAIERGSHLADAITIERSASDALRFAGFLVAAGLILGRSVAGTWIDVAQTIQDYLALAWPALVLGVIETGVGMWRDRDRAAAVRNHAFGGAAIGLAYLIAAGGYVVYLGWWT